MWRWPALAFLLGAAPVVAAPVRISVGTATGVPGGSATIVVSMDPVDQSVLGTSNDIEFSALTPVRRLAGGALDCAAEPTVGSLLPPSFVCIAVPPVDCLRLRAIVFRPFGDPPLTGGGLYSCTFSIDPSVAVGATFPLRIRAAQATGPVGRGLTTQGESGMIQVIAPPPTATPSETPVPSNTPVPSATQTVPPTDTPTRTQTRPPTRTRTATTTPLTPIPTPTSTATPVIGLSVTAGRARPGATTRVAVALTDRGGRVSGITFDLLVPTLAFDVHLVAAGCVLDARVAEHGLSATAVGDPPPPEDYRRVRVVVSEQSSPGREIGSGPLVACDAPVLDSAMPGRYPIPLDRLFAGDVDGMLLLGVGGASGTLVIDPDAPSPTPSATATRTASATATPTTSPSATAVPSHTATATAVNSATSLPPTATESATPSATAARPCDGDCNGDGAIAINELVAGVAIAVGGMPTTICAAADVNHDGVVTIDELVAAVGGALAGCAQ